MKSLDIRLLFRTSRDEAHGGQRDCLGEDSLVAYLDTGPSDRLTVDVRDYERAVNALFAAIGSPDTPSSRAGGGRLCQSVAAQDRLCQIMGSAFALVISQSLLRSARQKCVRFRNQTFRRM